MAVAVICEFNPFHNGHAYLLRQVKQQKDQPVVAVMSGSFTQRGETAICSKFERAQTALRNGADLVVELPIVRAVSNAQRFASGGVAVAGSFSCVDTLAFGCETDDLSLLSAAAEAAHSPDVQARVAELMSQGEYYPRALHQAVEAACGEQTAQVLASPNNILAVEYLRAVKGTGIEPLPILRTGAAHDSDSPKDGFASASLIRKKLRAGEDVSAYVPEVPREITDESLLERVLLYRLRTMTAEELAALPEVSEGLENRITDAVSKYNSIEEILSAVKTKRYIHARLRRIMVYALLGITESLQAQQPGYVRVLGMNDAGASMLRDCRFEVVTSPAKTLKTSPCLRPFLEKDILATDIAALAFDRVKQCGTDYLTKIIKENCAN
ncbi:MAG: nucleotidyltransferase family protein [Ruminococcus sp.]|nr:nucleotidyltransferase family protein [Ruminococcus sp.]